MKNAAQAAKNLLLDIVHPDDKAAFTASMEVSGHCLDIRLAPSSRAWGLSGTGKLEPDGCAQADATDPLLAARSRKDLDEWRQQAGMAVWDGEALCCCYGECFLGQTISHGSFKVFATLSLVDMISNPLRNIRGDSEMSTLALAGLSTRMGNLALADGAACGRRGAYCRRFGKCSGPPRQALKTRVAGRRRLPAPRIRKCRPWRRRREDLAPQRAFTASEVGQAEAISGDGGFFGQGQYRGPARRSLRLAAATATDTWPRGRYFQRHHVRLRHQGCRNGPCGRCADGHLQ